MSASQFRYAVGDKAFDVAGREIEILEVDEGDTAVPYFGRVTHLDTRKWYASNELFGPFNKMDVKETVDVLGEVTRTVMEAQPPQDPKAKFGATKANLALNPGTAAVEQALALEDGAIKYGPFNWRYNPVEAMTYLAAAARHLDCYKDRQNLVEDSGRVVHNLGAVMACCAILIDAEKAGTLVDNRPHNGHAAASQDASKEAKQKNWAGRVIDWTKGLKP